MMAKQPRITLEQWQALVSVVDAGSYAGAAERLHKSQSALTYAVQKIESLLNVKAFEIKGRKAILTATGQMLYRRGLTLLNEASDLEDAASTVSAGFEAEIRVAAEILFPTWLLLRCLERFGQESPRTRIEIIESVLGGTSEALLNGAADLAISPQPPMGFLGDRLMSMSVVAVARADHPLHQLGRKLSQRDLRAYRHLVVRDSGAKRDRRAVSVEVDQRWTVSHMATSIAAVRVGYGFAWLPQDHIRKELQSGELKPLPLREGGERVVELYLILANTDFAGLGVRRLAAIIREEVASECPKREPGAQAKG